MNAFSIATASGGFSAGLVLGIVVNLVGLGLGFVFFYLTCCCYPPFLPLGAIVAGSLPMYALTYNFEDSLFTTSLMVGLFTMTLGYVTSRNWAKRPAVHSVASMVFGEVLGLLAWYAFGPFCGVYVGGLATFFAVGDYKMTRAAYGRC